MDNIIKGIKIKGSSTVYNIEASSMKINDEDIEEIISELRSAVNDINALRTNVETLIAFKAEVENELEEIRTELNSLTESNEQLSEPTEPTKPTEP